MLGKLQSSMVHTQHSQNWKEFILNYHSEDPISSVNFSPYSSRSLLVSSWSGAVSLIDVHTNSLRTGYFHPRPVLDACFQLPGFVCSGGLDNTLKLFDIEAEKQTIIGCHDGVIRRVEFCPHLNCVLTGGWDGFLKMWDVRTHQSVGTLIQPNMIYTMSLSGEKCVVGTSNRIVCIWDLRNCGRALQMRDSSLKYQIRNIKCFPTGEGYAVSSIEGRVAIEYFDPGPEIQAKKYTFKCHRIKEDGIEKIYPVNSISFHDSYNTFATGGSDGYVNIWDWTNKRRLSQLHQYPASIVSLSFSKGGSYLAIASSFMFDDTKRDTIPPSRVYIRKIDQEAKPKERNVE